MQIVDKDSQISVLDIKLLRLVQVVFWRHLKIGRHGEKRRREQDHSSYLLGGLWMKYVKFSNFQIETSNNLILIILIIIFWETQNYLKICIILSQTIDIKLFISSTATSGIWCLFDTSYNSKAVVIFRALKKFNYSLLPWTNVSPTFSIKGNI